MAHMGSTWSRQSTLYGNPVHRRGSYVHTGSPTEICASRITPIPIMLSLSSFGAGSTVRPEEGNHSEAKHIPSGADHT